MLGILPSTFYAPNLFLIYATLMTIDILGALPSAL